MDLSVATMAFEALIALGDPTRLGFLLFGVICGLLLGVIPGLGGLVGLSLLLPFTFTLDPYTAIAFLMGLSAVTATSDSIPAVMFGVPGTVGAAATVVDGFPMARKGEAGRALGAAFTASVLGGLFGALVLLFTIPMLRPAILAIAKPEMLAITIFGLSLAATLSGRSQVRGLLVACVGLIFATVGQSRSGELRWTFDTLYLFDGLHIIPITLGLFALPEIADMIIQRSSIARQGSPAKITMRAQWEGAKDVFRNYSLVLALLWYRSGTGGGPRHRSHGYRLDRLRPRIEKRQGSFQDIRKRRRPRRDCIGIVKQCQGRRLTRSHGRFRYSRARLPWHSFWQAC